MMIRNLGPTEKTVYQNDRVCSWNFLAHASLRGKADAALLEAALARVQEKHPLLRARIMRKGWTGLVFDSSEVGAIPLRVVEGPESEWPDYAQAQLREKFDTSRGPLARCILIRHDEESSTLIAAFHHAIGDAMSGVFFLQDLVEAARFGSVAPGSNPALSLRQPMESYFPKWAGGISGLRRHLAFIFRTLKKRILLGRPSMPTPEKKAAPKDREACLLYRELGPEHVRALVARARENETTVHGALSAALVQAVARDRNAEAPLPFMLASDINLRSRLTPPVEKDLGFFITGVFNSFRAEAKDGFWDLAREIRSLLKQSIERGEHFTGVQKILGNTQALLGLAGSGDFGARACSGVTAAADPGALVLSNIGSVSLDTLNPDLVIEKLGFVSSPSAAATLILHTATAKECMALNFVCMEPLYTRPRLEGIADSMMEILVEHSAARTA